MVKHSRVENSKTSAIAERWMVLVAAPTRAPLQVPNWHRHCTTGPEGDPAMNVSMNPTALAAITKHSEHVHGGGQASNPAKQAKAADPAAKGAAFGALVAQFAHAKHA